MPEAFTSRRAPLRSPPTLLAIASLALATLAPIAGEGVAFAQSPGPDGAPPSDQPAAPSAHDEKLPADDDEENHRAVLFAADVAFTRPDLGLLYDDLAFDRTGANGTMYGITAGYRVRHVRFGLRWRVHDTTEFALWSFALSAGYALPLRPIIPIFSAHLGYVFDQELESPLFRSSLPSGNVLPPNVDVKGVLLGLDANAAYEITKGIRLGPFVGVDFLFLHRARAPRAESIFGPTPQTDALPLYTESGGAIGLTLNAGIRGAFEIAVQ